MGVSGEDEGVNVSVDGLGDDGYHAADGVSEDDDVGGCPAEFSVADFLYEGVECGGLGDGGNFSGEGFPGFSGAESVDGECGVAASP